MLPDLWNDLRFRLRALFRARSLDRELDDELQFHLEREAEKLIRGGLSPDEARRRARVSFGGVERTKDDVRDTRGVVLVDQTVRDARFAARALRRNPAFSIVAIVTLALGIGATTAVFAVVDGVLLRPLPFPDPERLVLLSYAPPPGPFFSFPGLFDNTYADFRQRDRLLVHSAAFSTIPVTITGAGEPLSTPVGVVTPDFFATLGVGAARGRTFLPDDDRPDRSDIVVLSDSLWRARFGADPRVVGSAVNVDGRPRVVVGIMPPGFAFPVSATMWMPMRVELDPHRVRLVAVVGRLPEGTSMARARGAFAALAPSLALPHDMDRKELTARVLPLDDIVVGDARRPLLVFAGAVALVLLIGCTNVANLLLMRAASREREIAMRAALGASRGRLVRQLLTESLVLGVSGGVVGAALAHWGVRALLALAPEGTIPRADAVHLDARVLAFALLASAASAILFGLAPALHATRTQLRTAAGDGARSGGRRRGWLRGGLVVAEIAVALVLLVGAGLMLRSFREMRQVPLGFDPRSTVATKVELSNAKYRDPPAMQAFITRVLGGMRELPGADAVGVVSWRPLGGQLTAGDFQIEGGPALPPGYMADKIHVSADYFRAMGIALRRGRAFGEQDQATSPGVVIVSASVARRFWGDRDPVGARLTMSDHPGPGDWLTVVGVVDDVVQKGVTLGRDAALYMPYTQAPNTFWLYDLSFVARTSGSPEPLARGMHAVLRDADPDLPIGPISEMEELVARTTGDSLFQTRLLGAFSLLALLLAAVGIYGVLAYSVAEQRREIGVRMALGAEPHQVMRLMLRRAAVLVIPGLGLGVIGALAATRVIEKLLFGVTPTDPATFAGVAGVLALAALLAAWAPARRASRVDPIATLRQE